MTTPEIERISGRGTLSIVCMAAVILMAVAALFELAMHIPGIATPPGSTRQMLGATGLAVGLTAAAFCFAPGALKDKPGALGQLTARLTRAIGLTIPTLPRVTGRRSTVVGLVSVLAVIVVLDSAGVQLIVDTFGEHLSLVGVHEDWRYLAIEGAPPLSVVLMTFLSAPVAEEVAFRGLPLALITVTALIPRLRRWQPLVTSGIAIVAVTAFAFNHHAFGALNVATTAWSGALYMATALLTRSLYIPIAAHFATNLLVFAQWLDW